MNTPAPIPKKHFISDEEKMELFKTFFLLLRDVINASECKLDENDVRQYASALAVKVFRQASSLNHLLSGTPIPYVEPVTSFWDFASTTAITRSALEAYLIFHHIFIASTSEEERQYKYFAWIMDSLIQRKELYPPHIYESLRKIDEIKDELPDLKSIFENDDREVQKIRELLKDNKFFKELMASSEKERKDRYAKMLKEGWFPGGWVHLQERIPQLARLNTHQFLSGVVHSNYFHMRQIRHAKTQKEQQELSNLDISVFLVILARLSLELPLVFPQSRSALEGNPKATIFAEASLKASEKLNT